MQWLVDNGHIKKGDDGLDYGCGKGYDAEEMNFTGFDPHHCPVELDRFFDVVTCNYVLNVIEDEDERFFAELRVIFLAKKKAFIAVRNDVHALNGCTSKGTWQGIVEPYSDKWKLLESNTKFKLWMYTPSTECEGMDNDI